MVHELKTWAEYFIPVHLGLKTFELRKNDRNFTVGDTLVLKEYVPDGYSQVNPDEMTGKYTGRQVTMTVSYVLKDATSFGLMPNYVILGIINPTK